MKIKLSWYEVAVCAGVGVRRKIESLRTRLKPLHKFQAHDGFELDLQGACGEMAAAKALGLYWDGGVGTFKAPDVGPYQIRTRMSDNYRGLALRDNDKDEEITILVTGHIPEFEVVGWIKNVDGKLPSLLRKLHRDRPATFVVPEDVLNSIESLPHILSPDSTPAGSTPAKKKPSSKRPR